MLLNQGQSLKILARIQDLIDQEELEQATELFDENYNNFAKDLDIQKIALAIAIMLNHEEECIIYFVDYLESRKINDSEIAHILGEAFLHIQYQAIALKYFKLAQKLGPTPEANHNISIYLEMIKPSIAEANLPTGVDPQVREEALLAIDLGCYLCSRDKYKEALPHFQHAVDIVPDSAMAHAFLSTTYDGLNQFELSEGAIKKAYALDPAEFHAAYFSYVFAFRALKSTETQIFLEQLLQLKNGTVSQRIKIIELLILSNKNILALEYAKKVLKEPELLERDGLAVHLFKLVIFAIYREHGRDGIQPWINLELDSLGGKLPETLSIIVKMIDPYTLWQDNFLISDSNTWFPITLITSLKQILSTHPDDQIKSILLKDYPEIEKMTLNALYTGDSFSSDRALKLAKYVVKDQDLLDFVHGKVGLRRARLKAAVLAVQRGLLPHAQPIKFWDQSGWSEKTVYGFNLKPEPESVGEILPKEFLKQYKIALNFIDAQKYTQALPVIKKLLTKLPENNQILALYAQALDSTEEQEATLKKIFMSDQNNIFSRCDLANFYGDELDQEKSFVLLEPITKMQTLTPKELSCFGDSIITWYIDSYSEGNMQNAKDWYDMIIYAIPVEKYPECYYQINELKMMISDMILDEIGGEEILEAGNF